MNALKSSQDHWWEITGPKKKDIIKLIDGNITKYQRELDALRTSRQGDDNEDRKRDVAKSEMVVFKWKVIKLLCEGDGVLLTG